ncbi:hypothetical protein ACM7U4_06285 [Pseudomonas aeruginosa]
MTHALFKQIDLTAKLGQDGSSLQAMNALRVIRETVAKHLAGAEAAEEHPLERAILALRTIAEFPCPDQDNMPAANMRQIALAALDGAGASSEPGNPGGEPVSGPGNAGEQAEAERPEVVAFIHERTGAVANAEMVRAMEEGSVLSGYSIGLVTLARYDRDVGALRFERQQMDRAFTACINERDAANARLHEVATACATAEQERDAALAEVEADRDLVKIMQEQIDALRSSEEVALASVAELEHVLRVVVNAADHGSWPTTVMHGIEKVREVLAGSAPPAKAQHSVPEGWRLVPIEPTPEMLDARRDSEDGMDGYLVEDTEYYFPDRGAVRDFLACVYRGLLAAAPAPGGER